MENIAFVSPAEFLTRFAVAYGPDRRAHTRYGIALRPPLTEPVSAVPVEPPAPAARAASRASHVRIAGAAVAAVAIAVTAASYGASLAWVLWFVRESGASWLESLLGRAG